MIEYKLLNNNVGILLSRNPEITNSTLDVMFTGVPAPATAIFGNGETSYYRKLEEEKCSIPVKNLSGVVRIVVKVTGETKSSKWTCDELIVTPLQNGSVMIAPNDLNLQKELIELRLENDCIRKANQELFEKLSELERRLDEIMEAYDIT